MKLVLQTVLSALMAAALFFVSTEVVVHQSRLAEENAILQNENATLKQVIQEEATEIESLVDKAAEKPRA